MKIMCDYEQCGREIDYREGFYAVMRGVYHTRCVVARFGKDIKKLLGRS